MKTKSEHDLGFVLIGDGCAFNSDPCLRAHMADRLVLLRSFLTFAPARVFAGPTPPVTTNHHPLQLNGSKFFTGIFEATNLAKVQCNATQREFGDFTKEIECRELVL